MATLTTVRADLRLDLKDSPADRWTDAVLDRHIAHALRELSAALPRERKTTLTTTAGSRTLSLSTLTDRVAVVALEWPTSLFPKSFQPFSVWEDTLTLLGASVPAGAENADVYWHSLHTLDASTSTLPTWAEDILKLGAAGRAALEYAQYTANRVNVGGQDADRDYKSFGEARLREFRLLLRKYGESARVRSRRLYTPAEPQDSQTRDFGP